MKFQDREQAAELLAERLADYRGQNPLILAIPRGAAPMARILAASLGGEVDVVLVRKLGAPGNPELAIGAVDESGRVYLNDVARELVVSDDYVQREAAAQLRLIRQRRAQYTPVRPSIDPRGRVVIVVDDGIATGATMLAALRAVRARRPARLVVATAVAPGEVVQLLRREADEVVCLSQPVSFFAIGQFFADFRQVADEEVIAALRGDQAAAHPLGLA